MFHETQPIVLELDVVHLLCYPIPQQWQCATPHSLALELHTEKYITYTSYIKSKGLELVDQNENPRSWITWYVSETEQTKCTLFKIWRLKLTIVPKKAIWHYWCFGQSYIIIQKVKSKHLVCLGFLDISRDPAFRIFILTHKFWDININSKDSRLPIFYFILINSGPVKVNHDTVC